MITIEPGILSNQYGVVNIPWSYDISSKIHDSNGNILTVTTNDPDNITINGHILTFSYSLETIIEGKQGIPGKPVLITITDIYGLNITQTIHIRVVNSYGTVSGKVTDMNNNSIQEVIVKDNSSSRTTTTDTNGDYILTNVPETNQPYMLTASKNGYVHQINYPVVIASQTVIQEFQLKPIIAGIISYDSITKTISVESGTNTLAIIYNNLNNPAILSYDSVTNTYIVNAIIFVKYTANLTINNTTLKFNSSYDTEYYLMNYGGLNISNSTITTTGVYTGYVYNGGTLGWSFNMTDSTLTKMGCNGCWDAGRSTYHISALTLGYPISYDGNKPKGHVTVNNSHFYNIKSGYMHLDTASGENHFTVTNNSFHDISSNRSGNDALIKLNTHGSTFSNNRIYNTSGVSTIRTEGYKNTTINYNEFYNVSGTAIYTKHSNNITIKGNYFHDGAGVAIDSFKTDVTADIIEDNIVTDYYAGSYYSMTTLGLTTGGVGNRYTNNTFTNITGNLFSISGVNDFVFENNTIKNVSGTAIVITPDAYQNSKNVTFRNNILTGVTGLNLEIKDANIDQTSVFTNESYENGKVRMYYSVIPGFINLQNPSVGLSTDYSNPYFYNYKYLDVKVVDINNVPINNTTVTLINTTDINYPSINIAGDTKTTFITGIDGHTPLPSNTINSIAILDYYKTSTIQQKMSYTVTASYNNYINSTIITPDETWYRINPDTYQNTVTIQLPIDIGCPVPICNITITPT